MPARRAAVDRTESWRRSRSWASSTGMNSSEDSTRKRMERAQGGTTGFGGDGSVNSRGRQGTAKAHPGAEERQCAAGCAVQTVRAKYSKNDQRRGGSAL